MSRAPFDRRVLLVPAAGAASGASPGSPGVLLSHYVRVLRHRWAVPLVGALVGLLLAAAFLWVRPPLTTATATVQIDIISEHPFGRDRAASTLLDPATERQLASSHVTAVRASELLGGTPTPAQVQAASGAEVLPDGTIVRLWFADVDATVARQGADALAQSYLAERGEQAQRQLTESMEAIDDRLEELGQMQADALERIDAAPTGTAAAATAESDRQLVRAEIDSLVNERVRLRGIAVRGGTILTPAAQASVSQDPSPTMVLTSGLAGGLMLGTLAAFLLSHVSRRVTGPDELADLVDAAVWLPDSDDQTGRRGARREQGPQERAGADRAGAAGPAATGSAVDPADGTSGGRPIAPTVGPLRSTGELFAAASAGLGRVALLSDLPAGPTELIAQTLSAAVQGNGPTPPELDVVPAEGSRADRLAAIRRSEAVLLIVDRTRSRRGEIAGLRDDIAGMGRPVLGALLTRWRS